MQRLIALMALLFGLSAAGAAAPAAEVPATEAEAVRAVIQAQLDAFAADDAQAAFSYATPGIQRMFATPGKFIAMVRSAYPVVWRPASVSLRRIEWADSDLTQAVEMADAKGGVWLVLYRLERQADRSWRIGACAIVTSSGRTA